MYSDGYVVAIPREKLEEAMQVFTSCRLRRPLGAVCRCARDAAAGTFCPCITAAAGALGSNDRIVFEAVADEIERRMTGQHVPEVAATPTAQDERGRTAGRQAADDVGRRMSEDAIDDVLKQTFPASDPPSWTLGRSR